MLCASQTHTDTRICTAPDRTHALRNRACISDHLVHSPHLPTYLFDLRCTHHVTPAHPQHIPNKSQTKVTDTPTSHTTFPVHLGHTHVYPHRVLTGNALYAHKQSMHLRHLCVLSSLPEQTSTSGTNSCQCVQSMLISCPFRKNFPSTVSDDAP
jgi:hypothetical protein